MTVHGVRCPFCLKVFPRLNTQGICRACMREMETLIPDLAERTMPSEEELEEIHTRMKTVRKAKARLGGADLTRKELNKVLPREVMPRKVDQ